MIDAGSKNAVVCITDRNYLIPTQVMLGSLVEHLDSTIEILVISSEVTKRDFEKMSYARRVTAVIDPATNRSFELAKSNAFSGPTHVKADAMAKLFLPFLVPNYQRVLYLDVDMICCSTEINSLFEIELKRNLVAAVPDSKLAADDFNKKLGLASGPSYFNSGLLLFDIPACRQFLTQDLVIDRAASIAKIIRFVDQDTLNYLYRGQVHYLPLRFNVFANVHIGYSVTLSLEEICNSRYASRLAFNREIQEEALRQRVILHYTSSSKPWKVFSGYDELWWKVAQRIGISLDPEKRGRIPHLLTQKFLWKLKKIRKAILRPKRTWKLLEARMTGGTLRKRIRLLSKQQHELLKRVKGLSKLTISYPIALDLRWADDVESLSSELRTLQFEFEFSQRPLVVLAPCFDHYLDELEKMWPMSFLTKLPADECKKVVCWTPHLAGDDGDQSADALRAFSGELSTDSGIRQWVKQGDLRDATFMVSREARKKMMAQLSSSQYDKLLAYIYSHSDVE